jgi:hypothetical protein
MTASKTTIIWILFSALFFCQPLFVYSQDSTNSVDKVRSSLLRTSKQISRLQHELEIKLREKEIDQHDRKEIADLKKQIDALTFDFETSATHIARDDIYFDDELGLDWFGELEELTLPFLSAIRDLTERPRKIDKLEKRIKLLETKHKVYARATNYLKGLVLKDEGEARPIGRVQEIYRTQLEELTSKYDPDLIKLQLDETLTNLQNELASEHEDESLIETSRAFVQDFFKNRGRNLLVTLLTVMAFWWFFTRLRLWISKKRKIPLNPVTKKIIFASYNFMVIMICLVAALTCLYLFNDWLLMSMIIIASLMAAWTSRQWVPKFLQEVRLILNLGTVCENQRFIWKGVPWLVKEIGLYVTLVNPQLEGGEVRFPVGELVGNHSRPLVEHEHWFPTNTNDWVVLSDETYGKVECQTLEQVVLRLKGNTLKYYPTTDFLSLAPQNISKGFRYCIEFGLDYGIQSRICDEIIKMFDDGLRKHLKHHFENTPPNIHYCEVMFNSAGASSLNLMITIDVDGSCADRYRPLEREIQTALVHICNENGLVIPFTQLTVSLADNLIDVAKEIKLKPPG